MHAAFRVEADFLDVSPGLPQQGSALISETHGGAVEVRVLGVVFHAVVDNEVEVLLELLQVAVALCVNALPHGGEVHGVLDVVGVVGYLQENNNHNNLVLQSAVPVTFCCNVVFLIVAFFYIYIQKYLTK